MGIFERLWLDFTLFNLQLTMTQTGRVHKRTYSYA